MFSLPTQTMALMNLAGAGISAYGQYTSGQQANDAYGYNAVLAENNAKLIRQSAELVEYQQKKNLEATVGNQMARYAARGISVGTGSPLDVMTDTLAKGYLDIAVQNYNSEISARGQESDAAMSRYTGKQTQKRSTLNAGLTLLKGVTNYGIKQSNPYSTGY